MPGTKTDEDRKKITFYKCCRKKGLDEQETRKRWQTRKAAELTRKDI